MSAFAREAAEMAVYTAIRNFAEDVEDLDSIASPEDAGAVASGVLRDLELAGWRPAVPKEENRG